MQSPDAGFPACREVISQRLEIMVLVEISSPPLALEPTSRKRTHPDPADGHGPEKSRTRVPWPRQPRSFLGFRGDHGARRDLLVLEPLADGHIRRWSWPRNPGPGWDFVSCRDQLSIEYPCVTLTAAVANSAVSMHICRDVVRKSRLHTAIGFPRGWRYGARRDLLAYARVVDAVSTHADPCHVHRVPQRLRPVSSAL